MSYQVLARKWRPRDFSFLVGQSHICTTLNHALLSQHLHHAYLFTGKHGVGKTTIARILAKCLNCEKGITPNPCLECSTCLMIESSNCPDVIELDAASHPKVENIRDLLDKVSYRPIRCRFKIFLIDEVHMLSKHSFNALLKTLEEPPDHVKFIFATTEVEKLLPTVLSRCLQFNLRKIKNTEIISTLEKILNEENISFEPGALLRIANHAQGSLRDALSTLDLAINFEKKKVIENEVSELLGTLASSHLIQLIEFLITPKPEDLWNFLKKIEEFNPDYLQILSDLVHLFYQIQLLQLFPEEQSLLDAFDTEEIERMKNLSQKISKESVQLYYQIALLGQRDLNLHKNSEVGFNMTILRMLSFKPIITEDLKDIMTLPLKEEQPISHNYLENPKKPENLKASNINPEKKLSNSNYRLEESSSEISTIKNSQDWKAIIKYLDISGMTLALATYCEFQSYEHYLLHLNLSKSHSALNSPIQIKQLNDALCAYLKQSIKIVITVIEPKNNIQYSNISEKLTHTISSNDPHLKELIKIFDVDL